MTRIENAISRLLSFEKFLNPSKVKEMFKKTNLNELPPIWTASVMLSFDRWARVTEVSNIDRVDIDQLAFSFKTIIEKLSSEQRVELYTKIKESLKEE